MSYPAKAGYPVSHGLSDQSRPSRITGSPGFGREAQWIQLSKSWDTHQHSRDAMRPRRCQALSLVKRGRRECRVFCAPAASCARIENTRVSHHRSAEQSGIPCAMVLRLIPCSPRRPGSFATVIGVMRSIIANLTPASGRQDHTTSPSAFARFVSRATRVHRIPRSTFVTIAIRPSARGGTAESVMLFLANREAVYFSRVDWTGIRATRPSGKSVGPIRFGL
jgi:hypothetical protein